MDIIKEIDVNKPLTKDQLDMLEKASNLPISYDDDSPEFTKEELAQFKRISERGSPKTDCVKNPLRIR